MTFYPRLHTQDYIDLAIRTASKLGDIDERCISAPQGGAEVSKWRAAVVRYCLDDLGCSARGLSKRLGRHDHSGFRHYRRRWLATWQIAYEELCEAMENA